MSDNGWQNDWIIDDNSQNQSSDQVKSTSSTPKYEIHDNTGYGNTNSSFRPTLKVLKRDTASIEAQKNQTVSQISRPDYKTREEQYDKAREKIFGSPHTSGDDRSSNSSKESVGGSRRSYNTTASSKNTNDSRRRQIQTRGNNIP
jgi:hypothetical protein